MEQEVIGLHHVQCDLDGQDAKKPPVSQRLSLIFTVQLAGLSLRGPAFAFGFLFLLLVFGRVLPKYETAADGDAGGNDNILSLAVLIGPRRSDAGPERIVVRAIPVAVFDHERLVRWSSTHFDFSLRATVNTCARRHGNGEPFGNQQRSTPHVETFNLGHELERAATAVAVTKTVPKACDGIDRELPPVAALVNGTTADKVVADALEPGVEMVMGENGGERHDTSQVVEIAHRLPLNFTFASSKRCVLHSLYLV